MNPNEFYELNEKQKEEHLKATVQNIKQRNDGLLIKMLNIFKRTVKHYPADFLVHDLYILKEHNQRFLWLVRPTGTNLILLDDCTLDKDGWIQMCWYKAVKQQLSPEKYYLIDNVKKSIQKITEEKADLIMKTQESKYLSDPALV